MMYTKQTVLVTCTPNFHTYTWNAAHKLNRFSYIIYGHFRKFVKLSIIFWTIHLLDSALNCIDTLDTYCATHVADLSLFCLENDFMLPLSDKNLVTEAFKSTSKYRRLTNNDNPYFGHIPRSHSVT